MTTLAAIAGSLRRSPANRLYPDYADYQRKRGTRL
jgi:hypothetical protein